MIDASVKKLNRGLIDKTIKHVVWKIKAVYKIMGVHIVILWTPTSFDTGLLKISTLI